MNNYSREEISKVTHFDAKDKFPSPDEVRYYFYMKGISIPLYIDDYEITEDNPSMPTSKVLAEMAEIVIENRWHCDFEDTALDIVLYKNPDPTKRDLYSTDDRFRAMPDARIELAELRKKIEVVNISVFTEKFVKKVDDAREMYLAANLIENEQDHKIEQSFWRAVISHVIYLAQELGIEHPKLKFAESEKKSTEENQ